MRDHDHSNDESRAELLAAIARWKTTSAPPQAAGTLAHLAWWDRYYASRWQLRVNGHTDAHKGFGPSITDSLNEAGAGLWDRLSLEEAASRLMAAANTVDAIVAGLPEEIVAEVERQGAHRLLERAIHRREHLRELAQ